ncbi:MAG: fructosamine kinase family protein [Bdellovibrionaceae bacterium]|nr:fructosamine kinase family protein [Pseudobdellovibrionaceae bacterium]
MLSVDKNRLVLEKVNMQACRQNQLLQLGRELAKMHLVKADAFGWEYDNYIGLNPQKNEWSQNWGQFFVDFRLQFQVQIIQQKAVKDEFAKILAKLKDPLVSFLNKEVKEASLLHGDLWAGNYLCDKDSVWLIDPAVYYGDREVDLAMSEMFGDSMKKPPRRSQN